MTPESVAVGEAKSCATHSIRHVWVRADRIVAGDAPAPIEVHEVGEGGTMRHMSVVDVWKQGA